jgi:hypothetical protein
MKLKIVGIFLLLSLLAPLPRLMGADASTSVSSAEVSSEDDSLLEEAQTRSGKFKRINRLCVKALTVRCSLSVNGKFLVNGFDFSTPASIAAAIAAAGLPSVASTGPITTPGPLTIGGCALTCVGGVLNVNGTAITGGTLGAAEFVRTIAQPGPVAPGTAFTIDTPVFNNIALLGAAAGAGGTVFTFGTPGTYVLDYEMSLSAAASVGVYTGPNAGALALDTHSVAGSTTGTTWIHGRSFVTVGGSPVVVAISAVTSTDVVVTAGPAPQIMIRLTILKVA